MMQQNDIYLIGRVLEGHTRDYALLVDRYKNLAFTIAYRVLGNTEDAEEVTQDSFVKAFRNLALFKNHAKFSTWLFRIVYNTAISKKRIRKLPTHSLDDMQVFNITEEEQGGSDMTATRETLLEKAMMKLAEEERTLLTLYYLNGSGVDEIHSITGLSRTNIKVRLFRARRKLQEILKPIMVELYV
jgi:RNA polymerase sigma-70 factor (ECF subfamily)